jgi:Rps23 Pro-64 3,4-dihydroxylase Tpa1-like proline 4-hydroxylase
MLTASSYLCATPFPHTVVTDAMDPEYLLSVEAELSQITKWNGRSAHQFAQQKKWCSRTNYMGEKTRATIGFLNGPDFLPKLEEMSGIEGLISDPYLEGGGVHSIATGGYLGIHADFNFHPKLRLHRRINLILYLNSEWQESWGGALELWSVDSKSREREIFPHLGTMVIFNTTDTSLHGHPHPLKCPPDRLRNSIALYYYSADRPADELSLPHSTKYYRT